MTISSSQLLTRTVTVAAVAAAGVMLSGCSLLGGIVNGGSGSGGTESRPTDSATKSPDSGTGTSTKTDVFTIKVGDCLNDADVGTTVTDVPTIACSEPHDSEAFSSFLMADGIFPGADAVATQAETGCTTDFAKFVGIALDQSELSYSYYFPTVESWKNGDREIVCLVTDPAGRTSGTLQGAAR